MKIAKVFTLCFALLLLKITGAYGQAGANDLPKIIGKDGRYALLVDGKPFLVLGGQAHNSSAWPGMLPQLWAAAEMMHLNTLELPIYWEQVEAEPGKFDFSVVDAILTQAREHHVHLVFLWFGTWKNGSNHYMPEWMKHDAAKYPNITGNKGQYVDSPSPHTKATLDADINAFAAVMRHLKEADAQHTVIMVQVENESGAWGSVRDYSPVAQKLFEGPVPFELLKPEVLKAMNTPVVSGGSWQKVFGNNADEYFHAWSVAHFIQQVTAAGKKEYPLPMYVNVALRDPLTNPPATNYESGGPTDNVIPIWKAAAPAIDLLAPDIYLPEIEKVLKVIELYDRKDNPLFVPEAALTHDNAKYLFDVVARGGIGFSPFGIDDNGQGATKDELEARLEPFAKEYEMIKPMMRELAQWSFDGKVKAVVERDDHAEQRIELGNWQALVSFGQQKAGSLQPNAKPMGKLMIVKLAENKFLVTGTQSHITFRPVEKYAGKAWQYLKVEEGQYQNGVFKSLRILNGDETDWGGPSFGDTPVVLQISLVAR